MSDRSPLDRPIYTADIAIHDLRFAGGELWIVATMSLNEAASAR